jgi:hypothetical protein
MNFNVHAQQVTRIPDPQISEVQEALKVNLLNNW